MAPPKLDVQHAAAPHRGAYHSPGTPHTEAAAATVVGPITAELDVAAPVSWPPPHAAINQQAQSWDTVLPSVFTGHPEPLEAADRVRSVVGAIPVAAELPFARQAPLDAGPALALTSGRALPPSCGHQGLLPWPPP